MFIASAVKTGGNLDRGSLSGAMWVAEPAWANPLKLELPFGVNAIDLVPTVVEYEGRSYITGGHTANIMLDEHLRLLKMGISPPTSPPSVAATGSGVTYSCYLSFFDAKTEERSTLSEGFDVVGSASTTRTWTNLPIRPPDEIVVLDGTVTSTGTTITGTQTNFGVLRPGDRVVISGASTRWLMVTAVASKTSMTVDQTTTASGTLSVRTSSRITDVELWVAADGSLPRLAVRRPIGTTTAVETVATLALGEAFIDTFEKFPRCSMSAIYHDRHFLAGDPTAPDTVYISLPFFPERYSGLNFRTRNGEHITALIPTRNYLLVCTAESSYIFQGYTAEDFSLTPQDSSLGCISNNMWAPVYSTIQIANSRGIWLYNDEWHNLIESRLDEWQNTVVTRRVAFEEGFTYVNPSDRIISFVPTTTDAWTEDFSGVAPEVSGVFSGARWSNDTPLGTISAYLRAAGATVGSVYHGSGGAIYVEDYTVAAVNAFIRTNHLTFGDPGGDEEEGGKMLSKLWTYVESENSSWTVRIFGGDAGEYVSEPPPDAQILWFDDVAASALNIDFGGYTINYQKKTTHWHPVELDCGRGFTLEFKLNTPLGVIFSGFGGTVGPGPTTRPPVEDAPG